MKTEVRRLKASERRFLERSLELQDESAPKLGEELLGGCMPIGCMTLLILATALVIALFAWPPNKGAHGELVWKTYGPPVAAAFVGVPFALWLAGALTRLFRMPKRLAAIASRKERIRSDLSEGKVRVERDHASAAVRAFGPERGERYYFLQLADQRVLFLGPWENPENDVGDRPRYTPDGGTFPSTIFEVVKAAHSDVIVDVLGQGAYLPLSDEFDLGKGWGLEPGTIVAARWENLRKVYG